MSNFFQKYRKIFFVAGFIIIYLFIYIIISKYIETITNPDKTKIYFEMFYYASGVMLIFGVVVAYDSLLDDHEYKRRAYFIDIMNNWNESNRDGLTFIIRKIIKDLNSAQRKNIMQYEEFEVNEELSHFIKICVCHCIKCSSNCENCTYIAKKDKNFNITKQSVIILRQCIVNYLNRVECVLSAAINNVSDFEMTKEQFYYLAEYTENYISMLSDFGVVKNFPCTKKFIDRVNFESFKGKKATG